MVISSCAHCFGNNHSKGAVSDSDISCSECVIMPVSPSTGKVESFVRVKSDLSLFLGNAQAQTTEKHPKKPRKQFDLLSRQMTDLAADMAKLKSMIE